MRRVGIHPLSRPLVQLHPSRLPAQRIAQVMNVDLDQLRRTGGLAAKCFDRQDHRPHQFVAALVERHLGCQQDFRRPVCHL